MARLEAADTPLTHADLSDDLIPRGFDRATIFRNLNDLADAGLVSRLELGDRVWRFEMKHERSAGAGEHPHFVCTDCGGVACLPPVRVALPRRDKGDKVRIGEVSDVLLRGRCESC